MPAESGATPSPLRPLPGQAERLPPGEWPVPRDGAAEDRRRRILAATAELVAKRGYQATTVELIVRRARVGRPAFHRLFDDKEAAFLALFDDTVERVGRRVEEARAECSAEPWPGQVAAVLRALFAAIAARPLLARACLVEVLTVGHAAVSRYERALERLRPLLAPGRAHNPRAAELADTLEDTLAGGVAWMVYQRLVAGEAGRVPELLPEALEFVLLPYLGEDETARAVAECL